LQPPPDVTDITTPSKTLREGFSKTLSSERKMLGQARKKVNSDAAAVCAAAARDNAKGSGAS
jgi:hypothetical protein